MSTRTLVEKFVVGFGDGRLQDALSLLYDEFVIHAAGDMPYSGDYLGAEGFSELIAKMTAVLDFTPSTDMQYIVDGGNVVLHYRLAFTSLASRKSIETGVTEVFSVCDGHDRGYRRVLQESVGSRSAAGNELEGAACRPPRRPCR